MKPNVLHYKHNHNKKGESMKVGDLVRHPLSGDIGIITDTTDESSSSDNTYYSVAFPDGGEFLIPQEHLELL